MNTNQLLDLVNRYQENRDFITNEESTKMALIVPFIRHLGYDPNSPKEVRLEFRAEFTHGDGKRHADRMDYAIFDESGAKPRMVFEAKPLGSDVRAYSPQLARYIGQMSDLHFGIITDGCTYLFFGDLESPNQMDKEPFFSFSLADPNTDWARVGKFLSKFSRDAFNAETLVTDAENSRYRQAMTEKIAAALRDPAAGEEFMQWLTAGVYKGHRTSKVMVRLGELAKEAVEPALISVLEDDFLNKLRERFQRTRDTSDETTDEESVEDDAPGNGEESAAPRRSSTAGAETTEEELEFYQAVRDICTAAGINADEVICRDTINYFNVSYQRPTNWFIRFFGDAKRKNIVTPVPVEDAKQLAQGFTVEQSPSAYGESRVYINSAAQIRALHDLVLRSFEVAQSGAG